MVTKRKPWAADKRKSLLYLAVAVGVILLAAALIMREYRQEPEPPPVSRDYDQPILAPASASVEQAQKWAKDSGAADEFVELAPLFWEIGERTGVNPVIAYAQSRLETGGFHWRGVVDSSYHNPAGIKTADGGGDYDSAAHMRFADWKEGITAQFEHLALYAGAEGYPLENPIDPRHFEWLYGIGPTVGTMSQSWATAQHYSDTLTELIDRLENTWVRIDGEWQH